jgi:hypothetical protein
MNAVTTIGLDIAKSVFQVHGINREGNVLIRRQLKRRYVLAFFQKLPPCLVGINSMETERPLRRARDTLFNGVVARARYARFKSSPVGVGAGNDAGKRGSPSSQCELVEVLATPEV